MTIGEALEGETIEAERHNSVGAKNRPEAQGEIIDVEVIGVTTSLRDGAPGQCCVRQTVVARSIGVNIG